MSRPFPAPPSGGPFRQGPDGARHIRAAVNAWQQARLARALGDDDGAALLRDQALGRARAAARHREQHRAWKLVVD